MKWNLILALLLAMLVGVGCVSRPTQDGGDGQGIEVIEEMSDEDYEILLLEIRIVTRTASRESNLTTAEGELVADMLETWADNPVTESIIDTLQRLDIKVDQAIGDVLQLAILEIQRRGGLFMFIGPDGNLMLSDRSRELVMTIAASIREGTSASD